MSRSGDPRDFEKNNQHNYWTINMRENESPAALSILGL